jgi:hypothetical protein
MRRFFLESFWVLLSPVFLMTSLFLASIHYPLPMGDLWLLAFLGWIICVAFPKKGFFVAVSILTVFSILHHMKLTTLHLWTLGLESSLALSFLISYLSANQLQQKLFSLTEENESLGQDLVALDKSSKTEEEKLALRQKILEQEKSQLTTKLDEKTALVTSYLALIEDFQKKNQERVDNREELVMENQENQKKLETLARDYQLGVDELNEYRKENHQQKLINEALAKTLQQELGKKDKEKEDLVKEKFLLEETLLQAKKEQEMLKRSLQEKEHRQDQEKDLRKEESEGAVSKVSEEIEHVLKEKEAVYKQLKDQFIQKNEILHKTRKQLFQAEEKFAAKCKDAEELCLTERSLEEKALLRDLQSMEEELTSYQEENQTLLDLIACISLETTSKKSKAIV